MIPAFGMTWRPTSSRRRPSFSPSALSTLVAHWDANSGVATSGTHPHGGGAVTGWTDIAGGRVMTPTAASRNPALTYSNGRRTVQFFGGTDNIDGVSDCVRTTTNIAAMATLPLSVFLVCGRVPQGSVADRVMHIGSDNLNNGLSMVYNITQTAMRALVGTGGAWTEVVIGAYDNACSMFSAHCTEAGITTFVGGTAGGTSAAVPNFGSSLIASFGLLPGNVAYNGPVFEALVFAGSTMSASDRQRIEGYLAHKWALAGSLPATHPWRFSAP